VGDTVAMSKILRKVIDSLILEKPNYHGEEVIGELNNYLYRGFVLEQRGELYLIQSEDGTKHLVKNIRRIGDLITRRQ